MQPSNLNPNSILGSQPGMGGFADDDEGFGKIDFDKLLPILNKSLGWIIVFILFSGGAGYLYLRWTRPTFESSSTLKLNIKQQGGDLFAKATQAEPTQTLSGEIELIKSKLLYSKVIEKLPLDVSYNRYGKFLYTELYRTSPFEVEYEVKNQVIYDKPIELELVDNKTFILKYRLGQTDREDPFTYNKYYENDLLRFRIKKTKFYDPSLHGEKFFFIINSRSSLLRLLEENLTAKVLNASANTIQVSFKDYSPEKCMEVVSTVDSVYLDVTVDNKNKANKQTLQFLAKLLDSTSNQLEISEREVENFIRRNRTSDVKSNVGKLIEEMDQLNEARLEVNLRKQQLNELQNMVSAGEELDTYIPTLRFIENGALVAMLGKLNEAQSDARIKSKHIYREGSTTASRVTREKLKEYKASVLSMIEADRKDVDRQLAAMNKRASQLEGEFNAMPGRDTELNRIKRYYDIHERYYLMLMEKQAEYGIAQAGIVPDFQILAPANLPMAPVSPQKGSVYTLWIVIGVVAGVVLVFVRYLLQDTVVTIKEIEKRTVAPLLGVVPVYTREKLRHARMVVDKSPKSSLSESLRAIRTNIEFMTGGSEANKKRIISITSTVASEGKTFIAINLSGVLALSGHKVVMLDLDMRKPKLHLGFDLANDKGMSTILIGKHTVEECVHHTTVDNIDVITAGPTPPNPSELLLRPVLDEVLVQLFQTYDLVLIDSPPVGLVTDGIIVMQKADLPIYVVRSEYSKRVYLKNINKLVKVNGFKNLTVILNGLDKFKTYGYGYGYGYDYYTDDDVPQGFDMSWFKNLLGARG